MPKDALLFVNPYIEDFSAYDHFMKPYGLLLLAAQFCESHEVYYLDAQARKDQVDRGPRSPAGTKGRKNRTQYDFCDPLSPLSSESLCGPLVSEKIQTPEVLSGVPRPYRRYGIAAGDFIAKAKALPAPPKYIFVTSMMTYWCGGVRYTISLLREIFPGAKILLGGNYACLLPEHARASSGADYVVAHKSLESAVRETRAIIAADEAGSAGARPLTHIPLWDILETKTWLPVLTTRGCPYRCSYCAGWTLEPFSVLENAKALELFTRARERYGTRAFAFYDDALLMHSAAHALPLFRELARRFSDIQLFTPNGVHARQITPELAESMRACGFADVRLSLESSDDAYTRSSGENGAKVTQADFTRAVGYLYDAGFKRGVIKAYCMAGAPGVSTESVHDTLEFARAQAVVPMLSWYGPVPGSRDFAELASRFDLSDPLTHNNTAWIYRAEESGAAADAYQELKHHEADVRREVRS